MQVQFSKLLLQCLVFVRIPYLIAKRIEKFLLNRLDLETKIKLNEKFKRFSEIDRVSEKMQNKLNRCRGEGTGTIWLTKLFIVDFATEIAIGDLIGTTV